MRYTGTNPNGINQVASGSVSVFVENTRVATFGTNTLQVTGSLNASGSISFIGPQSLEGNLTVITGSIRINSGTLGNVFGSPINGGIIYLGNDNTTSISRDFSSPVNILRFKLLGLSTGGGWIARYIWSLNDGPTEPAYDVMTLTGNSTPNRATATLVLSGSMTINGGGLSAGGTITGTNLASSTNTILSNGLFSLTSSIGSPFENAVFKIGTNGSMGWASRYFFKNNWQGTELDTLTLIGNNGVVTVGINNTSPAFTLDVSGSSRITNNLILTGSLTVVTGSSVELQVTNLGVKIGNASIDTHTVTGSLNVSGSLAVIGPIGISGSLGLVSGSAGVHVSQSLRQTNSTGSFIYGLNVTPTFTNTAPSQTQTAFRVNATFTGSFTGSNTSNIIADFGAASVGSQLTITDVTSGSIYMVNDVSGLPIIEATSDWTVNMYNYPSVIFRKTGSALVLGANTISSSVTTQASASFTAPVTFRNDTIFDEGVGVVYRMLQVSASTNAVAIPTASLYTLPMSVSSSVSMIALITGFGTGSRDTVSGEIRSTIKRVGGNASIVGTNIRFITADFSGSDANIVVSGSNAILVVTGSTAEPYAWRATITTQIV